MQGWKVKPRGNSAVKMREKDECPQCGYLLFGMPGSPDAICKNCGFKVPCCSD